MTATIRTRAFAALITALVLVSCATAREPEGAVADGAVAVRVENNLIPPTSLTVSIDSGLGSRQLLGTVDPSSTATLRFNPTGVGGQYRLIAETTAGTEIVSNPITLADAQAIRWDLSSNIATVVQ